METIDSLLSPPQQIASGNPVTWSKLAGITLDPWRMARQRIVAFNQRHKGAAAFDILRTKVLQDALQHGWRSLGITAPTSGCGKANVAVNLAISMAKHHKVRVALIDLDLRRPRISKILGHSSPHATEDFLRGECQAEAYLVRIGDNLVVGASPDTCIMPAELLHGPSTALTLQRLRQDLRADIIIYNLPALLDGDDCLGVLPLVESSLLVVGAEFSSIQDIDVCERQMRTRTQLLGVVLNKCRYDTNPGSNFQA